MNIIIDENGSVTGVSEGPKVMGVNYMEGEERANFLRENQIDPVMSADGVLVKSKHAPTDEEIAACEALIIPTGKWAGIKRGLVYKSFDSIDLTADAMNLYIDCALEIHETYKGESEATLIEKTNKLVNEKALLAFKE